MSIVQIRQYESSPFAEATIWIPRRDVPLSELNQHAIDAALEFLKSVVAAHPRA